MVSKRKVLGVGGLVAVGLAMTGAQGHRQADPYASLPSSLQLSAVVRDFKGSNLTGGHLDFERTPSAGYGQYAQMVNDSLDADGKPVFKTAGRRVSTTWKDVNNRPTIDTRSYITAKTGDRVGAMATGTGGASQSATTFAQWYRDIPGTNASKLITLNLVRTANTNTYTFNDQTDSYYTGRGGFFPIDGELLGNSSGSKNFSFTTEIDTNFEFQRGTGQLFTFTGDDDVWVFIDGKLVVDLGGVHSAASQSIELDRLAWLTSGNTYRLKIFHAERHTTQSNFRIDTTLQLRTIEQPAVNGLYD